MEEVNSSPCHSETEEVNSDQEMTPEAIPDVEVVTEIDPIRELENRILELEEELCQPLEVVYTYEGDHQTTHEFKGSLMSKLEETQFCGDEDVVVDFSDGKVTVSLERDIPDVECYTTCMGKGCDAEREVDGEGDARFLCEECITDEMSYSSEKLVKRMAKIVKAYEKSIAKKNKFVESVKIKHHCCFEVDDDEDVLAEDGEEKPAATFKDDSPCSRKPCCSIELVLDK